MHQVQGEGHEPQVLNRARAQQAAQRPGPHHEVDQVGGRRQGDRVGQALGRVALHPRPPGQGDEQQAHQGLRRRPGLGALRHRGGVVPPGPAHDRADGEDRQVAARAGAGGDDGHRQGRHHRQPGDPPAGAQGHPEDHQGQHEGEDRLGVQRPQDGIAVGVLGDEQVLHEHLARPEPHGVSDGHPVPQRRILRARHEQHRNDREGGGGRRRQPQAHEAPRGVVDPVEAPPLGVAAGHRVGQGHTGQDEEDEDGLMARPQQVEGTLGEDPVEGAGGDGAGPRPDLRKRRDGLQGVVDEHDDGGQPAQPVELDESHRCRLAGGGRGSGGGTGHAPILPCPPSRPRSPRSVAYAPLRREPRCQVRSWRRPGRNRARPGRAEPPRRCRARPGHERLSRRLAPRRRARAGMCPFRPGVAAARRPLEP